MGDVNGNLVCDHEFRETGCSERQSLHRADGEFMLVLSDFHEIWYKICTKCC